MPTDDPTDIPPEPTRLYTALEVAERLHVHPVTVRNWMRKGEIRTITLGKRSKRISQKDLYDFLEARAREGKTIVNKTV